MATLSESLAQELGNGALDDGALTAGLPRADDFARHPTGWYLFGPSRQVGRKPLSRELLGRRLVAYRTARGQVAVLDAHCRHLGADLGRGTVQGNLLQCPYHHWRYDERGECVSIPGCHNLPRSRPLASYPTVERHGYLFFYHGGEPAYPLPFFADCDPQKFTAARPFSFEVDAPWFMLVANGFDGQHFQAVHDRKLLGPPRVDCPTPYSRRMRFTAQVAGTAVCDRLLRRFVGRRVDVSITCWGGPLVVVEGRFGRAHSRLLVLSRPLSDERVHTDVIVFTRRAAAWRGGQAADWLSLTLRRIFTQSFMAYDTQRLAGVRYQPKGLIAQDHELIEFFRWLARLQPATVNSEDGNTKEGDA